MGAQLLPRCRAARRMDILVAVSSNGTRIRLELRRSRRTLRHPAGVAHRHRAVREHAYDVRPHHSRQSTHAWHERHRYRWSGRAHRSRLRALAARHDQSGFRAGGSRSRRAQSLRRRNLLSREAAVLPRGRGDLRVRYTPRVGAVRLLALRTLAAHRPYSPAHPRGLVQRCARPDHDPGRRKAERAHELGALARFRRRGHLARGRHGDRRRWLARDRRSRAAHELLRGPREEGLFRRARHARRARHGHHSINECGLLPVSPLGCISPWGRRITCIRRTAGGRLAATGSGAESKAAAPPLRPRRNPVCATTAARMQRI